MFYFLFLFIFLMAFANQLVPQRLTAFGFTCASSLLLLTNFEDVDPYPVKHGVLTNPRKLLAKMMFDKNLVFHLNSQVKSDLNWFKK